jgi:hypothetical protein
MHTNHQRLRLFFAWFGCVQPLRRILGAFCGAELERCLERCGLPPPVSPEQADRFLAQPGLARVREVVRNGAGWRELLKTPLMLSVCLIFNDLQR